MHFNYVWLRDHCRSASSYNSKTNQRNLDTGSIDLNIRPDNTAVEDGHLVLTCKSTFKCRIIQLAGSIKSYIQLPAHLHMTQL